MTRAHRLGEWGEEAALRFLGACGYRLLDRRFRRGGGEIDLVMQREAVVVFVEVKTRSRGALARPEAWVDRRKLQRLRRTARLWLAEHPSLGSAEFRFDVVAIRCHGPAAGAELRHLTGVG